MSEFLNACSAGNLEAIQKIFNENYEEIFVQNEFKQNGLILAVLNGQWKTAMFLLEICRISPHVIDSNNEHIFHHYVRGFQINPPVPEDFSEIREKLNNLWKADEIKELARLEELKKQYENEEPPTNLLVKFQEDNEKKLFGSISLFFPKYLLERFHVVISRNNNENKSPADLAKEFNLEEISEFYQDSVSKTSMKHRLVKGLNENLLRETSLFLE